MGSLTDLRVKVDGNEVGFFAADDQRLSEVKAARLVDAGDPLLVDLPLKSPANTNDKFCHSTAARTPSTPHVGTHRLDYWADFPGGTSTPSSVMVRCF